MGEEAEVLAEQNIKFEIVPGITSGIAAPAYAGITVTHRDFASSFAIVTGHGRAEKQEDISTGLPLPKALIRLPFTWA